MNINAINHKSSGMVLVLLLTLFALFLSSCNKDEEKDEPQFDHEYGNFTDTRDGHVYKTIKIGTQTWFAENLAYEGAGEEITDFDEWFLTTTYEGWCYYDNDKATYGSTYGILYQWGVASIACPDGWHLPTDEEWKQLEGTVDSLYGYPDPEWDDAGWRGFDAGLKLKSESGWDNGGNGTDEFGFMGLPGGSRGCNGSFGDLSATFFWSSGENGLNGCSRLLSCSDGKVFRFFIIKTNGYSVRCVRD